MASDPPCNHGECAWQDGCTLKGCPIVTTVAGDPWHGCSLLFGHSGDHDFSVRLYGAYPEFGIAPPADEEWEYADFYPGTNTQATGPESWAYYGPLDRKRRRKAGPWEPVEERE